MKRFSTLTAIIALTGGMAFAQETFVAGQDFMLSWDLDGDGQVTLAEAQERRESIFYMFDLDGNGVYSADEILGIDAHKAMEAELGKGVGQGGQAQAQGQMQGKSAVMAQANVQPTPQGYGVTPGTTYARGQGHAAVMPQTNVQPQGRGRMAVQTQQMPQTHVQPQARGRMAASQMPQTQQTPQAMMQPRGRAAVTNDALPLGQMQNQAALRPSAQDLATVDEILMFDSNKDGIVSLEEFVAGSDLWLNQRDRNGDGVITSADFGSGR
jgi:hypothetical protein